MLRGLDPEIRQGLMSPSVPGPVHHATSRRSLSPHRDYSRGISTVTRPSQASAKHAEDRPVHAQDIEVFKADMTSMLADMLQSSLSNFASQLKSNSGGQGESVSTQNVASDQEKEPSDHDDRSEGEIRLLARLSARSFMGG